MGEHRQILSALDEMEAAAQNKQKKECVALSAKVRTHIREEEEIFYPTAMMVGECARMRLGK